MTDLQKVPAKPDGTRPETGPMQFGDDWPGVFIRGDNALYFAHVLQTVFTSFKKPEHWPEEAGPDWVGTSVIGGLIETLRSCHMDLHR